MARWPRGSTDWRFETAEGRARDLLPPSLAEHVVDVLQAVYDLEQGLGPVGGPERLSIPTNPSGLHLDLSLRRLAEAWHRWGGA